MPPQLLVAQGPDAADEDLLRLACRGDPAAFRGIIERNNRRLFRLVRCVLGDDAEAEDAMQETYLRAFAHLDQFKGSASLSTWLTRIALNEALGRRRRRRAATSLAELTYAERDDRRAGVIPFPLTHAEPGDPEHVAARAEIRRLIERAIDALPAAFRVVFVLREIEQMSVEETARCLGIPAETVKTRLHRAKAKLRRGLDEQLATVLGDIFPFAGARCGRLTAAVLRRFGLRPP